MKAQARSFLLLSVALPFAVATTIACSSAAPAGAPTCKGTDCEEDNVTSSKKIDASTGSSTTPSIPRTPTDAGTPDASVSRKAPTDAGKPAPVTHDCVALSGCCRTVSDTWEKLACVGVSVAGNEGACTTALEICNAGDLGLGDIFGTASPQCERLAKCCKVMDSDGYSSAASDCRDWVSYEDEDSCSTMMDDYQPVYACE